jgi:ATP synthase protein I
LPKAAGRVKRIEAPIDSGRDLPDATRMAGNDDDEDVLKARLDKLAGELRTAKRKPDPGDAPLSPADRSAGAAWSMGMKASSEFVAAVVLGTAIGWGLDWLLHTKPAFTIVFFLFGVAAALWNVIRTTSPKGGK